MKSFYTSKITLFFILFLSLNSFAQEKHYYQTDFSVQDFNERRTKIFNAIGTNGIAVIQGARSVDGFEAFRQTNTFYYLTGIETGHAYLLFNGKRKLQHYIYPIEIREENEVKVKFYLLKTRN